MFWLVPPPVSKEVAVVDILKSDGGDLGGRERKAE
jgi:hypothetical protein